MDLTTMPITELKALAYDQLLQRDNASQNLQVINAELQRRAEEGESDAAEVTEAEETEEEEKN